MPNGLVGMKLSLSSALTATASFSGSAGNQACPAFGSASPLGSTVTALCGKTWVPTRDPNRYPVCPTCKEILEMARNLRK